MKKIFTILCILVSSSVVYAQQKVENAVNGTSGTLTVSFTTSKIGTTDGHNALAIWVQNASPVNLINTMMYYSNNGNSSGVNMKTWYALIGSWTNRNALKNADGISGATLTSYGTYTCYWGKTVNIATVPDGTYAVGLELIDRNDVDRVAKFTFTKGPTAQTLTPAASQNFSGISIKWVPAVSAINDVELAKLYNVYPNPTKSDIYVTGTDIESIQILSLDGRSMFFTKEQKLNLSKLNAGTYLAYITTAKGSFTKKIVKE